MKNTQQQPNDCVAPVMPKAQLLYGSVVYWLCVLSALICTVGPFFAMLDVENNYLNPQFLFGAIWAGKDVTGVWESAGGGFPGGHFWIDHFFTGGGFTQFGLVLGGACAGPALVVAAIAYLKDPVKKQPLWAGLALWTAFLIFVSAVGIIDAGH